jgi:hypothetical protein
METVLYIPQAAPPPSQPAPTIAPPPSVENSNLRRCADCGGQVSVHAESCPHCGATFIKKVKHGVFFYVFWGVISLIVTGLILMVAIAVVSGFFAGRRAAQAKLAQTVTSTTPKPVPLSAQDKVDAQAILSKLVRRKDEVTGITWLTPSWAEHYDNQIYLYIGVEKGEKPFPRLEIEYEGEEMLIINEFVFRIDDVVETIEPTEQVKSDYVAGKHWEWFDELAEQHLAVLEKIAKGRTVLMRYKGHQYNHDRTVPAVEKEWLDAMLLVYRYLKEQPQASL